MSPAATAARTRPASVAAASRTPPKPASARPEASTRAAAFAARSCSARRRGHSVQEAPPTRRGACGRRQTRAPVRRCIRSPSPGVRRHAPRPPPRYCSTVKVDLFSPGYSPVEKSQLCAFRLLRWHLYTKSVTDSAPEDEQKVGRGPKYLKRDRRMGE